MEKNGEEGTKPVRLEELGGSCTSGEEESRMAEFCQSPMRHLLLKGTMMMMITNDTK